eukprot:scaffold91582_cov54-Phaeocystis_antarctica.AAC.2
MPLRRTSSRVDRARSTAIVRACLPTCWTCSMYWRLGPALASAPQPCGPCLGRACVDPWLVVSAWLRGLRLSSTLSSQHAAPTAPKEVWYEGGLLPKEVCFATPGRADLSRLPDVRPEVELSHMGPKGAGACPAS